MNIDSYICRCSGVGTSCGLGGQGVLRGVDKTMLISNEIKKDSTHIQATMD